MGDGRKFQLGRLNLQPGDRLVVKYRGHASRQTRDRIAAYFERTLPAGVVPLVIDETLDLTVITRGQLERLQALARGDD